MRRSAGQARRNRRRAALRLALLAGALFLVGGVYSAVTPSASEAAGPELPAQIERGQQLFIQNCSSCHGLDAAGTQVAPDLRNIGAAAVDFQVSSGRMPMANAANTQRRGPTNFSREEIEAMAAYVGKLGNGPEIPNPSQYDTAGLSDEELARGGELFRTNCSACHNYAGLGGALPNGVYAPSLVGIPDRELHEAMRTGPNQMPVFTESSLSDEDTRAIIGYLTELHSQPDGGYTLLGLGPVGEGAAAWVLGIGGLAGFAMWIASKGARAR